MLIQIDIKSKTLYNNIDKNIIVSRKEITTMAKTGKKFSRSEVWEVATKYANCVKYSHTDFETEYESTRSSFYAVLDRAVIENVVDADTVEKMERKASYNAENKAGDAGAARTKKHYAYLKAKRKEYLLPKKEAINMTEMYAKSVYNKKSFCREYYISEQLLNRTIKKSIIENWISDEVVKQLKEKSIRNNPGKNTTRFWEEIFTFRAKNQG